MFSFSWALLGHLQYGVYHHIAALPHRELVEHRPCSLAVFSVAGTSKRATDMC